MVTVSSNGFTPHIIERYEEILGQFPGKQRRKSATDADVCCPVHEDQNPSLGVDLRQNGSGPRIMVNCRSQGCEYADILEAVGLSDADLQFGPSKVPAAPWEANSYGCTLEEYAVAKRLPMEFLTHKWIRLGDSACYVRQIDQEVPAVAMPYCGPDGKIVAVRFRVSISGKDRFRWRPGDESTLYGLHRLDEARDAGYVLLGEGESDCHSAWYHGRPAVGVPGAPTWKDEWDRYLEGIDKIIVVVEPDGAGEELWRRLQRREALSGRLRRLG
jgi:hypothetical protein